MHRLNNQATEGSPHFPHSLTLVTCLLPSSRPIPYRPRGFRVAGGVPPGPAGPTLVGGRGWGPHAHAPSYSWLCVASADNQIGKEGAEALAGALKTNTSLQTLDLRGENGGRGGEGRREERGREGELGDRTRTHRLTRGCVCHVFELVWMECLQATDSFFDIATHANFRERRHLRGD